jgi:peptidoglycan/LPS O-acetylase OafA/YrhL
VLSGFILGIPFARQHIAHANPVSIPRYLLRRVTRIEPPYLICLTVFWLGFYHHRLVPDYIAGLFYLHQIVYHAYNPILIPAWSLEVEVEFYLLAPLLCTLFAVRPAWLRRSVLAAFTLLYSGWVMRVLSHRRAVDHTLPVEIQFFLAGLLLADLYLCGWLRRARHVAWDLVAAGASVALLFSTVNGRWLFAGPVLISLIFVAAFRGLLLARFVRIRTVTIFGGMCYSIYLWHTAPTFWRLDRVEHLPFPLGFFATAASYLLLGILISIPMFVLVEKPFMGGNGSRLLERFLRRLTGRTAATQITTGGGALH